MYIIHIDVSVVMNLAAGYLGFKDNYDKFLNRGKCIFFLVELSSNSTGNRERTSREISYNSCNTKVT